jgi:DNA-binding transcriptional regulator YbjK
MTVHPTVKTRKNVPINSTTYLFISVSLIEAAGETAMSKCGEHITDEFRQNSHFSTLALATAYRLAVGRAPFRQ